MRRLILASAAAATLVSGLGTGGTAMAQAGSYQRSCRNPQNVNGVLTAECADAQGRYHSTSIQTGQCRGDIGNSNGTLACPGGQGTSGPVIGSNPQAQNQYRDDRRNDHRDNNGGGAVAGLVAGAILGGALAGANGAAPPPPPPPPPAYGDPRYGDPRYDWRYQQGGYGYGRRPGEWVPISERADWLNRQIDALLRDGRIDYRDARDYRRQLNDIQFRERDMQRMGRLGPRQRDELDRRFSDLTMEIRHDARED